MPTTLDRIFNRRALCPNDPRTPSLRESNTRTFKLACGNTMACANTYYLRGSQHTVFVLTFSETAPARKISRAWNLHHWFHCLQLKHTTALLAQQAGANGEVSLIKKIHAQNKPSC
ncbi:hypothetical protein TWF506_006002 [Arthrobotrys conoides]|uniref:Uncharacterized protein n=1 Tax=Arthrobotrys conoides TaxID=74498 RepID=A0AAN8S054_9PEZI